MVKLSSISNNKLTLLRKLNRKKYRYSEQLFLIEGARAVEQIISNEKCTVEALFFDENQHYWQQDLWSDLADSHSGFTMNSGDFAEIADTDNPQGVLALCQMPEEIPLEKLAQQPGMIIATDAIQDPGNLGTIIRTASWFGAKGVLSGKGTVDFFHPKVVRSTAGATGSIPHCNVDLAEALQIMEQHGWQVFLLDAGENSVNLKEVEKPREMVLVIGNEANGVDGALWQADRQNVKIDAKSRHQPVESLNAAIAASIAMYELG